MAVALAGATRRLEAFVFSTGLHRVTSPVRDAAAGRGPTQIDVDRGAWGGGTDIGASLHTFLTRHGERHLGRDTVVIIVSDGLDVGDPVTLRDAVQTLAPVRGSGVAESAARHARVRTDRAWHGGSAPVHLDLRQCVRCCESRAASASDSPAVSHGTG